MRRYERERRERRKEESTRRDEGVTGGVVMH